MRIQNINNQQKQSFTMNLKWGKNLRDAKAAGKISEKLSQELESLREWFAYFNPKDADAYVDFVEQPVLCATKDFQWVIKPFDVQKSNPRALNEDYGRYARGMHATAQEDFFNAKFPRIRLGMYGETLGQQIIKGDVEDLS